MGHTVLVKKIEQSGRLDKLHEDGRSVLDWARIGGAVEVVTLLKKAGAKDQKTPPR